MDAHIPLKGFVRGTFEISKTFGFAAAHQLVSLPAEHKCSRLHGHSYTVTVTLKAQILDEHGFVTDFANLAPFEDYLRTQLDHRSINDVLDIAPTSELLAMHFGAWIVTHVEPDLGEARLVAVTVSESATSSARWERFAS